MASWRDFRRPDDGGYFETRSTYLSQGDILEALPLLLITKPLLTEDIDDAGVVALIPVIETRAMIMTPTCDFRRQSADYLEARPDENPYQLRQQLVVARILPFEEWEVAQGSLGRSDRIGQVLTHDNQRQYMYLPAHGDRGQSLVDLGTVWTLPIDIVLEHDRETQLTLRGAQQLQYKLVMYQSAVVTDPESLLPPMD